MKQLDFFTASKLLKKYNIPFAKFDVVEHRVDALKVARKLGYPITLKIISPDIIHKTEVGAVIPNIPNEVKLVKAFRQLRKNAKAANAKIDGIMVQKMAEGKEIIIGGKTDPQFGQVVLFGLGGIFVEIIKDVAVRIAPINQREAREMMKEIKGYKILAGARGEKPVAQDKIAKTIVSVSKLLADHPEIREMDLNPLFVTDKQCVAVDVRIMV